MSRHEERYPYLVAWSPGTNIQHHEGLEGDVEMGESGVRQEATPGIPHASEERAGSGPSENREQVQYLAIDTNVFLNELRLIKSLYSLLSSHAREIKARILVPSTVINELDNLSKSDIVAGVSPDGDVHLSDLARSATAWLLEVARKSRRDSVVRCQKLYEKLDAQLRKGDDRILDCCLYFAKRSRVSLWTNDQNLSLLAEANDISTVGGSDTSLSRILQALNVLQTPSLQVTVRKLEEEARKAPVLPPAGTKPPHNGMELDVDLILSKMPQESLSGPTMHSLGLTSSFPSESPTPTRSRSSRSTSSSPTKNPSSPLFDSPPPPVNSLIPSGHVARRLPPALDTSFKIAFAPFASTSTLSSSWPSLDPSTSTEPPNISVARLVKNLLDRLTDLDTEVSQRLRPDNDDDNANYRRLLRCISSTRDVFAFLTPARFARTPRTGEVCTALKFLGDWVPVILGTGSRDDLYNLAEEIATSLI